MAIKKTICTAIMKNGNKRTSEKLIFNSLKKLQKLELKKNFNSLIKTSLINSSPVLFLKKIRRKRRNTIEFPFLLDSKLRIFYGIKFIIKNCNSNRSDSFSSQFNLEILNSSKANEKSVKLKQELYREAFSKKKFANYRWF